MSVIASGISCETLYDGRVIAYTVSSVSKASITQWSNIALQTLQEWPKDRPYLALHDISKPGIGLLYAASVENDIFNIGIVPAARTRIQEELLLPNPGWTLALALVVSPSLSGRFARLLFQDASQETSIYQKAYFDRSSALAWLAKMGGFAP
ncbi:MAG: hypothetical protein IPK19_20345 [Chloroflexi bacterium]|nr:hypothetical protein [Chloroflexota bacterium]